MSLINEALKKAQRQRNAGEIDPTAVHGGTLSGRSQPRSAMSLVLIGAGAVALVVVSVIVTLRLANSTPPAAVTPPMPVTKTEPAPVVTKSAPPPAPVEPAPTIVPEKKVAVSPPVSPKSPPEQPPRVVERTPAPVVKAEPPVTTIPQSTGNRPSPAVPPSPAPIVGAQPSAQPNPARPEPVEREQATRVERAAPATPVLAERINAFLDTAIIKGALPRGAESRVIMNERFYRLNEFVDRTLQLRLIKVESNNLTFSDENGAIYVKYF